jgi:hypothetical protein
VDGLGKKGGGWSFLRGSGWGSGLCHLLRSSPGLKAPMSLLQFPGLKAGASTVVPLRGTLMR